MDEFYRTVAGRQFIDSTMPRIAKALERLGDVLANEATNIEVVTLLRDHLSAWEDEEDSVQKEHAPLIFRTRSLLKQLEPKK